MTAAITTCAQPGCGGTIEDGYCDVCGLASTPAAAPASDPSAPGPSASAPSASAPSASAPSGPAATSAVRRQQLSVEILQAALQWCTSGQPPGRGPILGCEPHQRALRFGLERGYLALARLSTDKARRIEFVDLANAVRPRTLA